MREAPALAGVTRARPRPAAVAKAKASPRKSGPPATLIGRAFARPGVTAAGAVFAALMTGIVANAMFLQKGHHPAPLFKQSPAAVVAAPPPPAAMAAPAPAEIAPPPPPAAPAAVTPPAAPTEVATAPVPKPVRAPHPAAPAAPKAPVASKAASVPHDGKPAAQAHRDSIGALIGDLTQDGHKAGSKPLGAKVAAAPHPHPAKAPLAGPAAAPQQ